MSTVQVKDVFDNEWGVDIDQLNRISNDSNIMVNMKNPNYQPALAHAIGGEDLAELHTAYLEDRSTDLYKADPILGFVNHRCKDVHYMHLNDDHSLVYWGGDAAEANECWSFQLSHNGFVDPRDAQPVDIDAAGITISVIPLFDFEDGDLDSDLDSDSDLEVNLALEPGAMLVREGERVFISGGGHPDLTVQFPTRSRDNTIVLTL